MLITEKLKRQKDFTNNEKIIANFILQYSGDLYELSTRKIAQKTFTSPAAVIRLTKKLGFKGFDEFKQKLVSELTYKNSDFQKANVNFPFSRNDTTREIVNDIGNLYIKTIKDSEKLLSPDKLVKTQMLIQNKSTIYIFSFGTYLNQAFSFKEKMMKIGRRVVIPDNLNYQLYEAECMGKNDVAIIISYSGETKKCLQIARICCQKKIPVIAITSVGENSLSKLSNEVLNISTQEALYSNIADYSVHLSVIFVLDILYSIIFKKNWDKSYRTKIDLAHLLENSRRTDNSLINY